MAKYLLLKHYRGAPAPVNDVPMDRWTPEEVAAHMQYMQDYATRLESTGEYVDGQALSPQGTFVRSGGEGAPPVTDGPFAETKPRSDAELLVDRLNEGFARGFPAEDGMGPPRSASARAPFRFELRGFEYVEDAKWYREGGYTADDPGGFTLLARLRKGGPESMNVVTPVNPGEEDGSQSSATYPENYRRWPDQDWVQLTGHTFDWHTYIQQADIVHEAGHWLGLRHTFEGGCGDNKNDLVDDTPQMTEESIATVVDPRPDSCPEKPGEDPVWNLMAYSADQRMFTKGQVRRMVAQYEKYRAATAARVPQ